MIVQTAFTLIDQCQLSIIDQLRQFFNPNDLYYGVQFPGIIPPDLIYQETSPGIPAPGIPFYIVDEEQVDDLRVPMIVVTGIAGAGKPAGFGQFGQKPEQTIDKIPVNPNTPLPVQVATTQNIDLNTYLVPGNVIDDDYILKLNDRVLVWSQINDPDNGIYVVSLSGPAVRSSDFNTESQFIQFTVINVLNGKVNQNKQFLQTTVVPVTLGISSIDYDEPEFDEYVEIIEPTITFGIRCGSTSQRARLSQLLMFTMSNRFAVRGQLEKQDIITQPNSPGFIRENGTSVEELPNGTAYQRVYKAEFSSTLFLQWNYRILRQEYVAALMEAKSNN